MCKHYFINQFDKVELGLKFLISVVCCYTKFWLNEWIHIYFTEKQASMDSNRDALTVLSKRSVSTNFTIVAYSKAKLESIVEIQRINSNTIFVY